METAKSPIFHKKPKDTGDGMTFYDALKKVAQGEKIHKKEWVDTKYYGYLKNEVLTLHNPEGKDHAWIVSLGDLEGKDYIIL